MILHQVAFKSKNGLIVAIVEWRHRPINARQSIALYDHLQRDHTVWRLENGRVVEASDIVSAYAPPWIGKVDHYVDGTEHLKEF